MNFVCIKFLLCLIPIRRLKAILPPKGDGGIQSFTDNQFLRRNTVGDDLAELAEVAVWGVDVDEELHYEPYPQWDG